MTNTQTEDGGGWLTEQRVERLAALTLALRTRGGWSAASAVGRGWEICGGPVREIEPLLETLSTAGVVRREADRYLLTKAGDRVAIAVRRGDRTALSLILLRAGLLHRQARLLLETASIDDARVLRCPTAVARAIAPQLLGILGRWPDVTLRPFLTVPAAVTEELSSAWALLPKPEIPAWAKEHALIGHRAEYYTWITERAIDPDRVFWVALERDDLGYDVEDRRVDPARRIEAKGSRGSNVAFFLTPNEWDKAERYRDRYEIHFWGSIDLDRPAPEEYSSLRADGWPRIITDPFEELAGDRWDMAASGWRINERTQAIP